MQNEKRFQKFKDGLICLELFTSNVFIEKKKETRFGKLVTGTRYGNYAIENETLEDTSDFIKDRGNYKYKYKIYFSVGHPPINRLFFRLLASSSS